MSDLRDRLVMLIVTLILAVGTIYVFVHPTDMNFTTWAGLVVTITGVYHWLNIRDDKEKDQ